MSRYSKQQYEDVAGILRKYYSGIAYGPEYSPGIASDFVSLFAADNPLVCIYCGYIEGATEICDSADGRLRDEHLFEGDFDKDKFLMACGLTTEG